MYKNSCTLRSLASSNFRSTVSNEMVLILLLSKAKKAKFRMRLFVIDKRDGTLTLDNAENDASQIAVLYSIKIPIRNLIFKNYVKKIYLHLVHWYSNRYSPKPQEKDLKHCLNTADLYLPLLVWILALKHKRITFFHSISIQWNWN